MHIEQRAELASHILLVLAKVCVRMRCRAFLWRYILYLSLLRKDVGLFCRDIGLFVLCLRRCMYEI